MAFLSCVLVTYREVELVLNHHTTVITLRSDSGWQK